MDGKEAEHRERREETNGGALKGRLFTKDGKPVRVLSTSLGLALLANAFMAPAAFGEAPGSGEGSGGPKLVEWSSDAVKAYFDPSLDWNIPLPAETDEEQDGADSGAGSGSAAGTGGTTVIHTGGGFGWDDLLLYHLLFNRGSVYSSAGWYGSRPSYNPYTGSRYSPKSFGADTFRNKPTVGSTVRPKTSSSSGSVTRRSTSSSKGGIGGKSSGFGSSSSGSRSSGGFGG